MGYIRRPSYYKDFRCIASDCTENCCIGWEIDVDEDTLAYYKSIGSDFSRRLCAAIAPADEQAGENAHFILDERERCPFLNDKNLCEVYLNLGEEHMAQICTDHPRYYEWFAGGREDGVGLCCEAAAELILRRRDRPEWDVTGEADEEPDEFEQALFAMRDRLFAIIKPETPVSFDEKLDRLHLACCEMQNEYDDLLFPVEGDAEYADEEDEPFRWSAMFWSEACLKALTERLMSLEINKDDWRGLLADVHARIPELLARRADFLAAYADQLYEYDELLEYFVYRHFMKALGDDVLIEKVQFALICTCFIQLLGIYRWLTDGRLTHWEQICLCKACSREIEYNEDNVEAVSRFLTMIKQMKSPASKRCERRCRGFLSHGSASSTASVR